MPAIKFNANIAGNVVPMQFIPQFKAAISLLNSAEHFENSLREYSAKVRMTPRLVQIAGLSTPKFIDPVQYIVEKSTIAIEAMKEVNSIINQVHFKKSGKQAIEEMQYDIISTVDTFYCLSLTQQAQVAELISELNNQNK